MGLTSFALFLVSLFNISTAQQVGTLWSPYLEWSAQNASYSGNPFDLVATVTFSHQGSNASHTTEMFYDGNNTWKWRFSGTQTGTWNYTSSSNDPELDGLSGTVTINPNPDSDAYGFVTQYQSQSHTKWARFKGNNGDIETFVPQFVMYHEDPAVYHDNPGYIDQSIETFFDEHGFNGFQLHSVGGQWFDMNGTQQVLASHSDPDIETFEAIELLITRAHAAGGLVHIWPWGDRSRRWSPTELSDGANGTIDKRLQRYIAARLGPLPGWTMGYGFDLFEWTDEEGLQQWHTYLQQHLGWPRFLGGRAGKNNLNQIYEGLDYSAYEWHRPSYNDYRNHLTTRPQKPAFSEDRFRIRDKAQHAEKDYDMQRTRRGLYDSAIAGGVANIWGNLLKPEGGHTEYSLPYPNPEQINTYARFIKGRLLKDMEPCNNLSNGQCLADISKDSYLIYREGTGSVNIDLSGASKTLKAIAIDTKKAYNPIGPCELTPANHTWNLPNNSDWAIAIGTFDGNADPGPAVGHSSCATLPVELTEFNVISNESDLTLSWSTASETNNAGFEIQQQNETGDLGFQAIDFVEGAGTTTQEQRYQYLLENLSPGTYTFRLKQIDFDGSFEYSEEIQHTIALEAAFKIDQAYPTPFNQSTTLKVSVARAQRVQVTLFDMLGRQVALLMDQNLSENTSYPVHVQAGEMPNGTYFVLVQGAEFVATERVVLMR